MMAQPTKITRTRFWVSIICYGAVLLIIGALLVRILDKDTQTTGALPGNCNSRAFAEIGGPFNLVNQDNVAVTEKTFLGKPTLIYFGFTYCPDICPLSLQSMALALDAAKAAGGRNIDDIQPILISIDPARDTPASLKNYVAAGGFPKGLIGLSGSQAQVDGAAKAFKVGFTKSPPKGGDAKDYTVDHTSIMYLMGRDGKLRSFFANDPDPNEVGQCIAALSKSGL
jgi:protein SCO1